MQSDTPDFSEDAEEVGECKVVSDDLTRYHFVSSDEPNKFHTVDLMDWWLSGSCSCENFDMRIRPLLRDRVIKPHTERAKCKHIRRAEKILCYRVKKVWASKLNPKEHHDEDDMQRERAEQSAWNRYQSDHLEDQYADSRHGDDSGDERD
jgi:hypothetical protein